MRTFLVCIALAFAGAARVSAQTSAASPAPAGSPLPVVTEPAHLPGPACTCPRAEQAIARAPDDAMAVVELERKWCDAQARHDVAFLEKVEAETFTFTDPAGKLTTKREEIAAAKEGGAPIAFQLTDVQAQIYGDTAIVTGQTSFVVAGGEPVPGAYRWTDVFVRQANGDWQVVASQATAVGQSKVAGAADGE